ncbi:MAG: hypothetical protein IRY92_01115, partial [Dactylosporangium sp.]|nr:hypothetical protein [Dactylosporangium sp.]
MTFDERRYEREVIRPLRSSGGRITIDRRKLYAIEPGMTGAEIRERIEQVRAYWRTTAAGSIPWLREQAQRLLAEDERLRQSAGDAMYEPSWWQAEAPQQAEPGRSEDDELAKFGERLARHVAQLVDAGAVREAERLLEAVAARVPDQSVLAEPQSLVRARLVEFDDLMRRADVAAAEQREDEAEALLVRASTIVADDPEPSRRIANLPLAPPAGFSAIDQPTAIRLTWQPPPFSAKGIVYRLVRAEAPVAGADDGVLLAESTDTEFVDTQPPMGVETHYAVFARRNPTAPWSRPARASATLTPTVTGLSLVNREGSISATWRTHPLVTEVRVRRSVGSPPATETDGVEVPATSIGFLDSMPATTEDIYYSFVVCYRDASGNERRSPMTVVLAPTPLPTSAVQDVRAEVLTA